MNNTQVPCGNNRPASMIIYEISGLNLLIFGVQWLELQGTIYTNARLAESAEDLPLFLFFESSTCIQLCGVWVAIMFRLLIKGV